MCAGGLIQSSRFMDPPGAWVALQLHCASQRFKLRLPLRSLGLVALARLDGVQCLVKRRQALKRLWDPTGALHKGGPGSAMSRSRFVWVGTDRGGTVIRWTGGQGLKADKAISTTL